MKNLYLGIAFFFLITHSGCAQAPAPTIPPVPSTAPTGSVQLWNGHDLSGWTSFFKAGAVAPPNFWTANNGVLQLIGKPSGYLRTNQAYSNYHLHVEWRWPEAAKTGVNNSGIFVDQCPPDVVWPYSVQYQLKTGFAGDLIAQGGLTFGTNPLTSKKLAPSNEKPEGEWNGCDIFCRDSSIEAFVNGLRQNFVDKLPVSSGQIALQMEGYRVEFRNIWLQQL